MLLLWGVFSPNLTQAQVRPSWYDYVRSDLEWHNIETEHFNVLFHLDSTGTGSSRTAQVVARIAEEIYDPITALYQHHPDTKVTFILKDFEDYSNGAAYFFDNKIEIWAPALDSPLRGDHNWLRNVITHEYTHIIQVQKAMKADRSLPFFYFQWLDYEDVKRPDVLYGYPNVIATYPIPVLSNPAWLAEGTAQYQRSFLHYDTWDTHRDMLLRTRVLEEKEMSLDEMGGFYSHSSLLREGVYNHGYAFTLYLANTYGEEVLSRLSEALSKWSNFNVQRAFKDAVGVSGDEVYHNWMTQLRQEYLQNTVSIRAHLVEGNLVEPEGFGNFHPHFSPDGRRLAYISNRGEDFNQMSLYVRDLDDGNVLSLNLGDSPDSYQTYTCILGHEHRLKREVGTTFSWHPDGRSIVYARTIETDRGHLYSDLYSMDLESRDVERLTFNQRASSPAFSPDGSKIVFVRQRDGSTNLYVLNLEDRSIDVVTDFDDGTQVSDPVWHPSASWIYFAWSGMEGRDLYRIQTDDGQYHIESVLSTDADERSPAFDGDGTTLYFSSDRSGIYNLYRMPTEGNTAAVTRLTNVLGGAFMPAVSPSGDIAFSQYQWDGYKIAVLDAGTPVSTEAGPLTYTSPAMFSKQDAVAVPPAPWTALHTFDDRDVEPLSGVVAAKVKEDGEIDLRAIPDLSDTMAGTSTVREYRNIFTSFAFFPIVRLDQYVSRKRSTLDARLPARSRAETLLRNTKVGVYMSSREVLEEISLLSGVFIGPASRTASSVSDFFSPNRLVKLERDAFLQFEYRKGFGFLPKRWSPQLSIELFNIRRNVENGLSIEEFPCTACFPDTTLADIAYSLWEADIFARSKVHRTLLLELGYRYSPYSVTTERFFSKEADQFIPESSSRYFIGRAYTAKAYFELPKRYRNSDVVPEQIRVELEYEYELGRLLDRFDIEGGILVPKYNRYGNHRLTFDARFGVRLPGRFNGGTHGLGLRLRASTLLGGEVDDFFNDYVGGLIGARGYPFYALGGNEVLWLQASYLFPVLPNIGKQFLFTYFDKLYARIYADAALSWSGPWPGLDQARRDIGAELRLGLGSFYLFPTALFVSATYGLDAFDYSLDEGFLTPDGNNFVQYGKDLLWHFGVLFEFDL